MASLPNVDGTVADPEPYHASLNRYLSSKSRPSTKPSQTQSSKRNIFQDRGYLLFSDEPPFRVFLRDNWVDLLTLLIADIGALVLWIWVPLFTSQLFPVRQNGGVVWPEYAYPLRREYIPTWLSAVISFFVPFAVMGLASIFLIGSFYDANSAIMGLGYALSASTLFQSFMKLFIGGLRPHFLSVCDPILPSPGRGFGSLFYDRDICTGEDRHIREALMSFPSGHSSAAFAGFGFLVLWLNAKFKIFANRQTRCWQLLVFSAPILVAVCIAGSKIVDRWHHPGDIIAGGIIGSIFAVLAYRMRYRAVWDWRYNHTPLTREGLGVEEWAVDKKLTAIDNAGWENLRTQKKQDKLESKGEQV